MKFLVMHGAIGNLSNIKVQIDPLIRELEGDNSATFVFLQGKVPVEPPAGFGEYFGPGPHWRWLRDGGTAEAAMLERVRDFPEADSAEDTLRALTQGDRKVEMSVEECLAEIREFLSNEEKETGVPVNGIIGYSEGALVAAALLLEEQRRLDSGKLDKRGLKVAVFFCGWPAVDPYGAGMLLCDETDERVLVPSVHVVGASDPFLKGAIALYNLFDEDTALLFDHAKGHILPRDPATIRELADAVRDKIRLASELENEAETES